jgi:hypothetical protein
MHTPFKQKSLSGFLMTAMLLMVIPLQSTAQDTLRVMHYNLLFYGYYTSFCTAQNNNVDQKDVNLLTIINHTRPDIFTVNEMGRGVANAIRIRDNVLNADGNEVYQHASYTNTANSSIVNMLFYNQEKFGLLYEAVISNNPRDINLYTLYYREPGLGDGRDTTFLTCVVAHFKAGSNTADQQRRTAEAQSAMGAIEQLGIRGNLLFLADFNMNSSHEQAYQYITYHPNEIIRFYDPIVKPGVWYNNPDMAPYHTQSPRTGSHPCFVTGGLDDRYDIILGSGSILSGEMGLKYIEGSYRALGQDGNRFNQSLISPANTSEPADVIQALYNMSDHLPVYMELLTTEITGSVGVPDYMQLTDIKFINPVFNTLELEVDGNPGAIVIRLFHPSGEKVFEQRDELSAFRQRFSYPLPWLPPGMYLLEITDEQGRRQVRKMLFLGGSGQ